MIKVNHLDKYFNKGKRSEIHVINEVNLEFPKQGLVILLGESGSGKTTLLNVLGGLDKVDKGTINIGENTIKQYKPTLWDKLRRDEIGYIFQNYNLIPNMSVFDNIAISLRLIGIEDEKIIKERVIYILEQVGMYKYRKRHAGQLSGGQQQRVAIARALVKAPNVIIADEPTGNLDTKNTVDVMNIIKKISEKRLVVLVTHERNIAKFYADRIIELHDGVIIDDYENETPDILDLEHSDEIYLKDFKHIKELGNVNYYHNSSSIDLEKEVKVSLIYKNGTLFLDIDSPLKKVKLVTPDNEVVIKNEHFTKDEKDEILQTDFDILSLEQEITHKKKDAFFKFSESVKFAFLNLLRMSKFERVMLIGFFITGMITAFSASILGNEYFKDYISISDLEGYVTLSKQNYNWDYDGFMSLGVTDDDPEFFINPYVNEKIYLSIPSAKSDTATYELLGYLDTLDHVSSDQLVHGRMPENDFEIVVDKSTYTLTNGLYNELAKSGVWSPEQLIGEVMVQKDFEFTIVGIVDTGAYRIYVPRDSLIVASYSTLNVNYKLLSLELLEDEVVLVDGRMPEEGHQYLLAPASWMGSFLPLWAFDHEDSYDYHGYEIVGTYDDTLIDLSYSPFIGYNIDIEFYALRSVVDDISIYSSEPSKLINTLLDNNYVATWSYRTAQIESENAGSSLISIVYISVFILMFSGVGVYYLMRSSMLSRIYNIAVYRALGVSKRAIRRRFVLELFMITTASTLFGYLVSCLGICLFQDASYLKDIVYLNVQSMLLGVVVIYTINLVFGTLSIEGQLRKTPTELFSNYDL